VQKITFVLRKINKNCCHQNCIFDSNMYKSFVGWDLQHSPDSLAVFRGLILKGGDRRGRGEQERGWNGGSSSFAL